MFNPFVFPFKASNNISNILLEFVLLAVVEKYSLKVVWMEFV